MSPLDRVLILVPRVHFYAPLVLEPVFRRIEDVQFKAVLTPKLPGDRGILNGLFSVLQRTGPRYLASQLGLRFLHRLMAAGESLRGMSLRERRYLEVPELLELSGVPGDQEESLSETTTQERVVEFNPDLILSVFFNQVIPDFVLEWPNLGSYNLHPGSLPEYRGYSPVFWQLLEGESRAGISLHRTTTAWDAGPVMMEDTCAVRRGETFYSLYRRLAERGGDLVVQFLRLIQKTGDVPGSETQDEQAAHTYSSFTRDDVKTFYTRGNRFWKWLDFCRRDQE